MRKTISGVKKFSSPYEAAAVCLLSIVAEREAAFIEFLGPKKGTEFIRADSPASLWALDEIWDYNALGDHNIVNDLAAAAKPEWSDNLSDEQITQFTGLLARDDFEAAMIQAFKMIGCQPIKYVTISEGELPEDLCNEYF